MKALELSTEDFRRLAANVVDLCAGYLCTLDERSTFPQTTGAESERIFDLDLPECGVGSLRRQVSPSSALWFAGCQKQSAAVLSSGR